MEDHANQHLEAMWHIEKEGREREGAVGRTR